MHRRLTLAWTSLAFTLGLGYAFLVPPLQVPDEYGHWFRAYAIAAQGRCMGEPLENVPASFVVLTSNFAGRLQDYRKLMPDDILRFRTLLLNDGLRSRQPTHNTALYTCVPYLPAAGAFSLARLADIGPLALIYTGRIVNLLIYIAAGILIISLVPSHRALFALLLLVPMCLHQAASLSADAIALPVQFLYLAWLLRLAAIHDRIVTRDIVITIALALLVTLTKFNFAVLPAVLIVPQDKWGGARRYAVALLALTIAVAATAAAWNIANRANIDAAAAHRLARGVNVEQNSAALLTSPGALVKSVLPTLADRLVPGVIGYFGWLAAPLALPWVAGLLAILILLAAVSGPPLSLRARIVLVLCSAAGLLLMLSAMFILEADAAALHRYRNGPALVIPGVQGRYFIPLLAPALLALTGLITRPRPAWLPPAALAYAALANLAALQLIRLVYYR